MSDNALPTPAGLRTDTMAAWRQHRYGEADAVALETAEVPAPRRGEVLLRVRATALNNGDVRVQLAALRGAEVWSLCGERNRELVESLGAARTFDYRTVQPGSPELESGSFDVVIDIAGTAPLGTLQGLVRDGGSVVPSKASRR